MKLSVPRFQGILIKRYKRFLADIELLDGRFITAHTPNTGSMLGVCSPGSKVWVYDSGNAKRKYPFSWDLVESDQGALVGIDTGLANYLVEEAIQLQRVPELAGYSSCQRESTYKKGTRFDLLLSGHEALADCYIEIKNVTALGAEGQAIFPDAPTERGRKHLQDLIEAVDSGFRAAMFFCVQRSDINSFFPAVNIDPEYAALLSEAHRAGVLVLAYRCNVSPDAISVNHVLPVEFA